MQYSKYLDHTRIDLRKLGVYPGACFELGYLDA